MIFVGSSLFFCFRIFFCILKFFFATEKNWKFFPFEKNIVISIKSINAQGNMNGTFRNDGVGLLVMRGRFGGAQFVARMPNTHQAIPMFHNFVYFVFFFYFFPRENNWIVGRWIQGKKIGNNLLLVCFKLQLFNVKKEKRKKTFFQYSPSGSYGSLKVTRKKLKLFQMELFETIWLEKFFSFYERIRLLGKCKLRKIQDVLNFNVVFFWMKLWR